MRKIISFLTVIVLCFCVCVSASAASQYTVVKGDSMWKIAVRYEIGLSEIISANPQVKNPNLIYPGDVLTIPSIDSGILDFENEVIIKKGKKTFHKVTA